MDTTSKPRMTPKDFFVQFGALITLYISAGALLTLAFSLINRVFPDALDYGYYYSDSVYSAGMRFAIASLVIIFPTYLILLWLINKDSKVNPEKKNLGLRRWLTYVTLFVSAALALGDLVTLLNYFLGGEITTRFILKVLAVIIVAAGVFLYYFSDLRKTIDTRKTYSIFAISAAVVVAATIVWGFSVMGLPQSQRDTQLDLSRVYDLQNIQSEISYYYQQKGTVPAELSDLIDSLSSYELPVDPETKQQYSYEKNSATGFKLCANFSTSDKDKPVSGLEAAPVSNDNWQHDSGQYCFVREIDPDLYPPIKN